MAISLLLSFLFSSLFWVYEVYQVGGFQVGAKVNVCSILPCFWGFHLDHFFPSIWKYMFSFYMCEIKSTHLDKFLTEVCVCFNFSFNHWSLVPGNGHPVFLVQFVLCCRLLGTISNIGDCFILVLWSITQEKEQQESLALEELELQKKAILTESENKLRVLQQEAETYRTVSLNNIQVPELWNYLYLKTIVLSPVSLNL